MLKHTLRLIHAPILLVILCTVFAHATAQAVFTDLSQSYQYFRAIDYLENEGIVRGYADGGFHPENPLSRIELLKILLEGGGFGLDAGFESNFPDVPTEVWHAPYIAKARALGWVQGYEDGTFRPNQPVSKIEAAKLLLKSRNLIPEDIAGHAPYSDIPRMAWYAPYIYLMQEKALISRATGLHFWPDKEIKRGLVSEWLFRLMALSKSGEAEYSEELGQAVYEGRLPAYLETKTAERAVIAAAEAAKLAAVAALAVVGDGAGAAPLVGAELSPAGVASIDQSVQVSKESAPTPVVAPLTPKKLSVSYENMFAYTDSKVPQNDMIVSIFKIKADNDFSEPAKQTAIINSIVLTVRGEGQATRFELFSYVEDEISSKLTEANGTHYGHMRKDTKFVFDLSKLTGSENVIPEGGHKVFMIRADVNATYKYQKLAFWLDSLGSPSSNSENPGDIIWSSEGVTYYWIDSNPNEMRIPEMYLDVNWQFITNPPVRVDTTALADGTVGIAYNETLAASGGTTPYAWTITVGALPAGLNLDGATGVISGVPAGAGVTNFTATVTDNVAPPRTASQALSITVN